MTLQELAKRYADQFTVETRDDKPFFTVANNAPDYETLCNLIYHAHENLLPDNHKYMFVCQALHAISESDDKQLNNNKEIVKLMPEQHANYQLCMWLASNLLRFGYCDEIIQDSRRMRKINHVGELLMIAYRDEQLYTIQQVKEQLQQQLEHTSNKD